VSGLSEQYFASEDASVAWCHREQPYQRTPWRFGLTAMETLPECGAESVKPKAAPFRGWAGKINLSA